MASNQLPEGVGKKIVDALKRQAEADVAPASLDQEGTLGSVPLTKIEDIPELNEISLDDITVGGEDEIIEETPVISLNENFVVKQPAPAPAPTPAPVSVPETSFYSAPAQNNIPVQNSVSMASNVVRPAVDTYNQKPAFNSANISIPTNVVKLNNLISSLPVGVTKQTGAVIIRQTLEAMGLPVNDVLKEAQAYQDQLNASNRECMVKIQECKTQIMQLESMVQVNQDNIQHVNDIVSLFINGEK